MKSSWVISHIDTEQMPCFRHCLWLHWQDKRSKLVSIHTNQPTNLMELSLHFSGTGQ